MCSSLRLRTEAKKTGILAELALVYCERSSVFCLLALVKLDRDKGIDRWNGTSLPFLDWVDELSWLRVHILYTSSQSFRRVMQSKRAAALHAGSWGQRLHV